VLLALDEMYNCPHPDLPHWLADGAGQGLLIYGALQDLAQASVWGRTGEGLLTLFQNVLVCPGIRHEPTLRLLSTLAGDMEIPQYSQGQSQTLTPGPFGFQQRVWVANESVSTQRVPKLPPDQIYRGDPNDPTRVLCFSAGGGWERINLRRYYCDVPWPFMLINSCEWVMREGNRASWGLPLPELARGGDPRYLHRLGGQPLVDDWWQLIEQHKRRWASLFETSRERLGADPDTYGRHHRTTPVLGT
jgi:hypothetical protein